MSEILKGHIVHRRHDGERSYAYGVPKVIRQQSLSPESSVKDFLNQIGNQLEKRRRSVEMKLFRARMKRIFEESFKKITPEINELTKNVYNFKIQEKRKNSDN